MKFAIQGVKDLEHQGALSDQSTAVKKRKGKQIRAALPHAVPVTVVVLGLFYFWFAVADRYAVFLYGHLGATPFDAVTCGRYWMTGLVAGGVVMLGYTLAGGLWGLLRSSRWPTWWAVWRWCAAPLLVGVPLITMTQNCPVLPFELAVTCALAALIALAIALVPAGWAAKSITDMIWLMFDGAGLMPALLFLRTIELIWEGWFPVQIVYAAVAAGLAGGVLWLGLMSYLRRRFSRPIPSAGSLFLAGICLTYLCLPLLHHVLATPPGHRYITASNNFIADHPLLQAVAMLVALGMAASITALRALLTDSFSELP